MDACFYEVKPGYERSALGLAEKKFKCILIIRYIIYFGNSSYGTKHHHCISERMNKNLICKRI